MSSADAAPDTAHPPRKTPRKNWDIVVLVVMVVALVSAGTYFNTNIFTAGRICNGWITPDGVADAFGGGLGRVSVTSESSRGCWIKRTSWLSSGEDEIETMNLRVESTSEHSPFREPEWEISADQHVMTGGVQGSFSEDGGGTLLPESCTRIALGEQPQAMLQIDVNTEDEADVAAIGRLLESATKAITSGPHGCTAPDFSTTPTTHHFSPSAVTEPDFANVCGVAGFKLAPPTTEIRQQVLEQTSGSFNEDWYCDVSVKGPDDNYPADDVVLQMGIVTDRRLVKRLGNAGFAHANCGGEETVFPVTVRHLPEQDRMQMGLPTTAHLSAAFSQAARHALHCT